jgi:trans-aconitate methyltransferase
MIAFARQKFPPAKISNLKFEIADAREIRFREKFDLIFSNATLHWVDDHEKILRGAASVLQPGGRLVVSCGGKGNAHEVFLALRPEMRLKRWCQYFRKMPLPYFFYAPSDYEKWLPKCGFKIQKLKLSPKDATYAGADGFATWLRITWLPFVQRVPDAVAQASRLCVPGANKQLTGGTPVPLRNLREEFIAAVTQRYLAKHPPDAEGKVHVRMVRLEIEAEKI